MTQPRTCEASDSWASFRQSTWPWLPNLFLWLETFTGSPFTRLKIFLYLFFQSMWREYLYTHCETDCSTSSPFKMTACGLRSTTFTLQCSTTFTRFETVQSIEFPILWKLHGCCGKFEGITYQNLFNYCVVLYFTSPTQYKQIQPLNHNNNGWYNSIKSLEVTFKCRNKLILDLERPAQDNQGFRLRFKRCRVILPGKSEASCLQLEPEHRDRLFCPRETGWAAKYSKQNQKDSRRGYLKKKNQVTFSLTNQSWTLIVINWSAKFNILKLCVWSLTIT